MLYLYYTLKYPYPVLHIDDVFRYNSVSTSGNFTTWDSINPKGSLAA